VAAVLLVRAAFRAGITDRVQHVANRGLRCLTGYAFRQVSTGDIEGPLSGMRIGAILHPTVLLALADGAGFVQRVDRPTAQSADRRSSLLGHQH